MLGVIAPTSLFARAFQMPRPWLLLPILACVVLTAPRVRASTPLPSGIADSAGRTGYFTMVRGHLEALDLQTGDTLWRSDAAHRALAIVGDRLFAFSKPGEKVRIVALDLRARGEVIFETDPLLLPAWSALRDEPGQSFRWVARAGPEYLEVYWEARAWYAGRERSTPEREAAARKSAGGLLRVNLLTGRVQVSSAEFPSTPLALPPVTLRESIRWSGGLDGWIFALVVDQTSAGQSAILRTWNAANSQESAARTILTGQRLQVIASLGGRHLFLRDTVPSPADTPTAPVRWHIWSLDRGEIVGKIPYEPGSHAGAMVGGRAFFVKVEPIPGSLDRPFTQPRTLQAMDPLSGKLLWERPIEGKVTAPPPP
jgi:hypothetical protein